MPTYVYKAVDPQGKKVSGEYEAASEVEVSTHLAKLGYLPVSIGYKEKAAAESAGGFFKRQQKVNIQSMVIFTREFATIIKAAVPIVEGLGVLAEQAEDAALKNALNHIVRDIQGGLSLSAAMAKHPGVFSDLYTNTVIAGESAGVLDKVLLRLAQMLEEEQETNSNIQAAVRYPVMVVVALLIAVIVLSTMVIPNFAKIYIDMKVDLPIPTQIMILISKFILGPWEGAALKSLWFSMLAGAGVGFMFFLKWLINTKSGRWIWDGLKFKTMIVGKIYSKITMLRFASMLSVLYQAGLPVLKAIDIVKMTIGNVVLAKEMDKVKHDVADGKGISGAVLNSPFFPRVMGYMISIGEKSGSLPMMLDSLCEYFTLEVRTSVRNLTTLIEPLMTAVLGIVVMGMALSIFLPMWGMIKVIQTMR